MKRKRAFVPVCSADRKCGSLRAASGCSVKSARVNKRRKRHGQHDPRHRPWAVGNERSVQEHHDDHLNDAVLDERHHCRIFIALHEREIDVVLSNNEQHGQTAEERVFEPPQPWSRELDGAQDQAGDDRPEGQSGRSGAARPNGLCRAPTNRCQTSRIAYATVSSREAAASLGRRIVPISPAKLAWLASPAAITASCAKPDDAGLSPRARR